MLFAPEEERQEALDLIEEHGTGSNFEKAVVGTNKGLRDVYEGTVDTGKMVYDTYKDPIATYKEIKDGVKFFASDKEHREIAWEITKETGSEIGTQVVEYSKKIASGDVEEISRVATNIAFMLAGDKAMSSITKTSKVSKFSMVTNKTDDVARVGKITNKVDDLVDSLYDAGYKMRKLDNVSDTANTIKKADNLVDASRGVRFADNIDDFGKVGIPQIPRNARQKNFLEVTRRGNKAGSGIGNSSYKSVTRMPDEQLIRVKTNVKGAENLTEWRRSISKSNIKAERIKFVGEDAVKIDAGTWRNLDGTRQFRTVPSDYLGKHGIGKPLIQNTPHVHFEFLAPPNAGGMNLRVIKNVHVPIR